MNNQLQIIDEREILGKEFKIYGDFENPLFLAKDVAEWIGHRNTSKMISDAELDDNEVEKNTLTTLTNSYSALFLTEDGLYEVLMQSRKPVAKQFKKKVRKILKSIRKNGMYIAQTKIQEKMFNAMRIEMTGLVDDLVSKKVDEIENKCSEYIRPLSKKKLNVCQYIKKRLGTEKADEEYELVKQRVLIKLGGTKWEDIPVKTLEDSLNTIDESIKIIKSDRTVNQLSLF
ncbi:Bro-N domain-containing protein [Tepidibacter hydrothermalis]|uniref:BRO family protein n=1 Tax=Tepidibacter hydrothermalis TaxID=3036126 RepID=A0ABY8E756_9FIRM|nr:BRO family protein [Tepidibacter hydrothermalis]WFD08726.1 BRO family protein [Tepidibacter hydrothermalis]